MAEEVKLFGNWASPFSHRIQVALKLKGIAYEYIEEDLHNKSPLLLKYNPVHRKIPVLVHNGRPIAESLVILDYIDETWKNSPLLPQHPYDKAMSRFWAQFIDQMLVPAAAKAYFGEEKEAEIAIEEASQHLKLLEDQLKGKDFFAGESFGYLDIVALLVGNWFEVIEEVAGGNLFNEDKFPIIFSWIRKVLSVDVVEQFLPPREKLLDYFRARLAQQPQDR